MITGDKSKNQIRRAAWHYRRLQMRQQIERILTCINSTEAGRFDGKRSGIFRKNSEKKYKTCETLKVFPDYENSSLRFIAMSCSNATSQPPHQISPILTPRRDMPMQKKRAGFPALFGFCLSCVGDHAIC